MAFVKTLLFGPKKPEGPSPALIKATQRQSERARDADKREKETLAAQFRRALSSGRNLLISGFRGGSAGGPSGAGAGTAGARGSISSNLPGQQFGGGGGDGGGISPPTGPAGGGPQF